MNTPPCKMCISFAICNAIIKSRSVGIKEYFSPYCEDTKIFFDNILYECDIVNEYLPFVTLTENFTKATGKQYNFLSISEQVQSIISRRLWSFRMRMLLKLFKIQINFDPYYSKKKELEKEFGIKL